MTRNTRISSAILSSALLAAACGTEPVDQQPPVTKKSVWKLDKTIALPAGADLQPDHADKPGEAKPQAVVAAGGKVYVALTNLVKGDGGYYSPAGPGAVAIYDAATLTLQKTVSLALQDAPACLNAGAMTVSGDRLYVACSGSFAGDGALASMKLDGSELRVLKVGGAPGSVAVAGTTVWLGDLLGGNLLAAKSDLTSVLHGDGGAAPIEVCPKGDAAFEMVGDVTVVGQTGYAACFGNDRVQPFDAGSGEKKGQPLDVGDGPQAFAHLTNGAKELLLVLDNLGSTLSTIELGDAPVAHKALLPLGQTPQGIAVQGTTAAVANSADGTVTFLKPSGDTFEKTASIDLKPASGGTTFPWGVALTETAAFVAINGTSQLAAVRLVEE